MKKLICIITIFLLIGCGSNSETIKLLKSSVKSYQNIKNSKEITTKSALIYLRYNQQNNTFLVSIASRDRESKLYLTNCIINNKESQILPTNQKAIDGIDWLESFEVDIIKPQKRLTLKCSLSNQDSFEATFDF